MERIRNFCIIAHIDHGKSTLADRLIQRCGAVSEREFRHQILDSMDIERERGITIKSNTITLHYTAQDGHEYRLNLIDTPGHVDFSHEVRRSLLASDGALLVIDASQGVEAQTVANMYLALEHDLEIVPVINKIDLPSADPERVREEIAEDLGLDPFEAPLCSAKDGTGIDDVLEAIVTEAAGAGGVRADAPLRALVFDAQYDPYRGVVLLVLREGGHAQEGPGDPLPPHRRRPRGGGPGEAPDQGGADEGAAGRQRGLRGRGHQVDRRHRDRRHHHGRRRTRRPSRSPATRRPSRSSSPRSTRCPPTTTRTWPRRWTSWR